MDGEIVTYCPMCGSELDRQSADFLTREDMRETELRLVDHLRNHHGRRYGLWLLCGRRTSRPWRWLLGVR